MLRRCVFIAIALGLSSTSLAGVAITLVPDIPYPPGGYQPGQQINIDVLAMLTPGTPSAPGPGGTMNSIRVRMMQFDLSDTDPALDVRTVRHDPDDLTPFWDFGGSTGCANDPSSCGLNYFIDGAIASDDILNITYTGLTTSGFLMITLNQTTPKRVGELLVTIPQAPGTYLLDVLNADETDLNQGAEIRWGFGSTADPTDPTSPLRANMGGFTGGQIRFTEIPEPATLALLGVGAFVACVGRRRSA